MYVYTYQYYISPLDTMICFQVDLKTLMTPCMGLPMVLLFASKIVAYSYRVAR